MEVKEGKEAPNNKTVKVVGLFMAAVVAVSAGCYWNAQRQIEQEEEDEQTTYSSYSGSHTGYYHNFFNSYSNRIGQISHMFSAAKGGIGSSFTGGGG